MWCRSPGQRWGSLGPARASPGGGDLAAWWGGLGGDDTMGDRGLGSRAGPAGCVQGWGVVWLRPSSGQTSFWRAWTWGSGETQRSGRAGGSRAPVVPLSPPRELTSAFCHWNLVGAAGPPESHCCGRGTAASPGGLATPYTKLLSLRKGPPWL